ncbi:MAG: ABC transporter permease subunit [Euryarchaeota archaeon]|jgi:glycine betaine/proline transport system permease protein|nr:ABC transporter permease subunit [Euryarchaeota archaeon]
MTSVVGTFAEALVDFVEYYFGWLLNLLGRVLDVPLDLLGNVLYDTEPLILIVAIAAISLLVTRRMITTAVITAAFAIIHWMGYWNSAMITLNMVIVSAAVAIVIAVPLGIWAARSEFANPVIKTLMDFMQTMPAFVYLIPAVIFFGLGVVPGVVATVIFAMPPVVRLTNLGIRQVPVEMDEVAESFGSTEFQKLTKVQLPTAMPSIMAGINQCIMLSLSMVVIAAMIGGGGLGQDIVFALNRVDVALGFEAGLAVVLIAIALDRLTQALRDGGNGSELRT